jgi:DNA-binding XRE family transcriptional regulator
MSNMGVNGQDRGVNSATGHFGRQMKKERLAHGWSLHELARRIRIDVGHLSRIENGKRPPSKKLATKCDELFPERRGWFTDWHDESRHWSEIPPGFRSWAEIEEKATSLRDWWPSIVSGLAQTEDYARAVLSIQPGVTSEAIASRLSARLERQRRVLERETPPLVWLIVDEVALYRLVGSPEIMAAQMRRLAEVAAMPNVTLTVMPLVLHPVNESGFIIADDEAVYAEHMAGGYTFTEPETLSSSMMRFDTLRAESRRASESLALIERMTGIWTAGVSRATAEATAERASRRPAPMA